MQATVSRFDADTRAGAVLLDDGLEVPFVGEALVDTGLRLLRPGQRVRVEIAGSGTERTVARLQILTLA
jgi:cold shock CspA family protein